MITSRRQVYCRAFTELDEIMKYMNKDIKEKIPNEFRNIIIKNKDISYQFQYDKQKALYDQDILPETKTLLSIIYTDYLCSKEEQEKWKKYDEYCFEKEQELKKEKSEVSFDNVAKNLNETRLIEVKSKNLFEKILDRIKSAFINKN